MKQKGFTLVEMLGVIVIIGLLAFIAFPPLLNQLTKSKEKLSSATIKVLEAHTELFVSDHGTDYPIKEGNVYCITIRTLVENGLPSPVIDASSGETINELEKSMKMTIIGYNNYKYEFVNTNECEEVKN